MLVLTRKHKQQIHIGDNIVITVQQIKGTSVRIGIEAPREISIRRSELLERDASPAPATVSLPLTFESRIAS